MSTLGKCFIFFVTVLLLSLFSSQAIATMPGSSGGSFSVDNSGAARYEVPILVPPGTRGMEPELSLGYSSRGGNGALGLGWTLKGLSSINRCPAGLKTDEGYYGAVHHDATDDFCLGNQRLMAVNGRYGFDGTEYRTEVERYAKIISHGNSHDDVGTTAPSWFEVLTKDGKRYIYGNSTDSRSTPIGSITVHSWLLTRVEDRRGNFYSITYSEEPETWRQPTRIDYTGNDRMGVTPVFAVHFAYKSRPDKRTGYVAGGKYPSQVLLDSITTSANNEVARTYRLGYKQSELTNRSRLETLQECGSQGECFEPMRFDWSNGDGDQAAPIAPPAVMTDKGYHDTSTFLTSTMVDMNGDGLLDWVTAWRDKWGQVTKTTWLQSRAGTWQHAPKLTIPGGDDSVLYDYYQHRETPLKNGLLQDVNGDGLPDWVLAHSYDKDKKIVIKKTWINTGSGWWLDERYTLPDVITDTIRFPTGENHGSFVDLNGDGLVDWVTAWKGNYHNGSRAVWINRTNSVEGNVWVRDDRWILPGYLINYSILLDKPGSNLNAKLIDINGDGLPDYVRAIRDRSGNVDKSTFLNTGSGWRRDERYTLPDLYIDYTVAGGMVYGSFVDVNGDGLVDWVRAFRNPWGQDSMATYLNTGRGWLEDEQYRMNGVIYDYREYSHKDPRRHIIQRHGTFVDFNGDGLVDWLQSYRPRSLNSWQKATWINTGTTWVNRSADLPPPEIIHDYSLFVDYQYSRGFDHGLFADIDGDGSKEWVQSYRDRNGGVHQSSVSFRRGSVDLITVFSDESNAEVRVEYRPMTDATVASHAQPAVDTSVPGKRFYDTYPLRKAVSDTPLVFLVRKKTVDTFFTPAWRSWEYRYGASRYDVGYGWQGFGWLHIHDRDKETIRMKSFYQRYPLTGRLESLEEIARPVGQPVKSIGEQVHSTYGVNGKAATPGSTPLCSQYPCRIQLLSKVTEQYDDSGRLVTTATLTNEGFDSFGNITRQQLVQQAGPDLQQVPAATTTKEFVYENREENWLIGLPVREKATHGKTGKADRSNVNEASFNSYAEPIALHHNPDKPEFTLNETFTYDDFGNVINHTSAVPDTERRTRETEYDPTGHHPVAEINSEGHRTEMHAFEERCGKPTSITDPNGLTTTYLYDQFCRIVEETRPDGTPTTFTYQQYSQVVPPAYSIYKQTKGGAATKEYFDMLGRKYQTDTQQIDKWVQKVLYYDKFDRIFAESIPLSGAMIDDSFKDQFSIYEYDLLDRVTMVRSPDGALTKKTYAGLTTTTTNPLGQTERVEKGVKGETLRIVDSDGQPLAYDYDASGNLLSTRDPHGNIVEMQYDPVNRKISMQDPDLGNWQYHYNGFGELVSQTDGNGQMTTIAYDRLGRMIKRAASDATSTWLWDTAQNGIGQLAETTGSEYEYTRLHHYDELGRPSATTVAVEGSPAYTTRWAYDAFSRVEQVVHPDNIAENLFYSTDGILKGKTIYHGEDLLSTWHLGMMDDWGHTTRETINGKLVLSNHYDDRRGRIDRSSAAVGGDLVKDLSYAWDPIGNLNRRVNGLQQNEELFDYDRLNRLVASRVNATVTEVEYDAIGNILWKSDVGRYSYGQNGAGPHAVSLVDTTAARNPIPFSDLNPAGNYHYDSNGNLLSGGGRSVQWTGLNMPRRITASNGADSYFLYGPEGQRIAKETAEGQLTVYLNEVHELVLDDENRAVSRLTLPLGSARAELLVSDKGVGNRYMLLDHLGSPEVILDQDLTVIEQLSFDPWGKRRQQDWSPAEQAISSSTPTGFTGHEMDDETGLINMAARLYDPLLGRFLSADTLIPQPENLQSFNRYSYVLNNPLRYVDPTGHEPDEEDGGPDATGVAEAGNDNQSKEDEDNRSGDYDGDGDVDPEKDNIYAGFKPTSDTPQEVEVIEPPTVASSTVPAEVAKSKSGFCEDRQKGKHIQGDQEPMACGGCHENWEDLGIPASYGRLASEIGFAIGSRGATAVASFILDNAQQIEDVICETLGTNKDKDKDKDSNNVDKNEEL